MFLSGVLLFHFVGRLHASHFHGVLMTYYPKDTYLNASVSVILHYKESYSTCTHSDPWSCSGNCGTENQILSLTEVDKISGLWCQREAVTSRLLPNNSPLTLELSGGNWIENVHNIIAWKARTYIELRNRSDIGKANTSPQTTILPVLRVPLNCQRNINFLAFDPDGDDVRCRYASSDMSECATCTTPSGLNLSSSCILSFNSSLNTSQGSYVVQMMMEDFPRQTISLTQTNGSQVQKTTGDSISKIPIQFALKVDPAAPSCTEGLYLPKFLSPTPNNRAQLYTPVNQMLEITIRAEAIQATSTELLFSGPYNANKNTLGSGNFSLTWTPSSSESGQSHPICFVVQANNGSSVFQSELRCVIVTVENSQTTTTLHTAATQPLSTTTLMPTTTQPFLTTTTPIPTTTTQPPTTPTPTPITSTQPFPTTTTPFSTTKTQPPPILPTMNEPSTKTTTQLPTTTTITTPILTTTTPPSTITTTTPIPTTTAQPPLTTTTIESSNMAANSGNTRTPYYVVALNGKISSRYSLENYYENIVNQIKEELIRRGLPSTMTVLFRRAVTKTNAP